MQESFKKSDRPEREKQRKSFLTPRMKETIKRLVVGCIFVLGTEAGIEVKTVEAQGIKPATIESIDIKPATIESIDSQRERNLKVLRPGEYLVPESVMAIFNEVYVSILRNAEIRTTLGYSIDQNSLRFLLARKAQFDARIKNINLSEDELRDTGEMFRVGNIIFGQESINNPNFIKLLWHERIHKYMAEDLSPQEQKALAEAKSFLIGNYFESNSTIGPIKKGVEEKFSAEIDALLKKSVGMQYEEYQRREREIIEKYYEKKEKTKPILREDNSGMSAEFQLYYMVQSRGDEFWSTLVQGNFTNTERYIENNFPKAYVVYKKMKGKATAENK